MLLTLLSWIAITLVCTSVGLASKHAFQYFFKNVQTLPWVLLPLVGLGKLTIVTTILSLFLPINVYVQAGIVLTALLYVVGDYRFVKLQLTQIIQELIILPKRYWLIMGGLGLGLALFASLPTVYFAFDTGLYHAQAIQWIHEFKVVPGLTNFHPQLGFNSSWFMITAVFDVGVHNINGWLLFWSIAFFGWSAWHKNHQPLSSALSLTILVVIAILSVSFMYPSQITTASTDMPAALWLLLSVLLFVQYIEKKVHSATDAWLIPVLTISVVLAITTKLSNAPVGLLLVYSFVQLVRQKQYRSLISQVLAGAAVLLPWLIRHIILSGYLLYPASLAGSLFAQFDWQVPLNDVRSMQDCITNWAQYRSCAITNTPWLPQWLTELRRSTLLADSKIIIAVSLGYIMIAFTAWRQTIRTFWSRLWPVYSISVLGLGFWFYSAPDVRFGIGFISLALVLLLLPALAALTHLLNPKMTIGLLAVLAIILLLAGGEYPLTTLSSKNLLTPSVYPISENQTKLLEDKTIYVSESVCWDQFPCTTRLNNIELRGPELSDGFRVKVE